MGEHEAEQHISLNESEKKALHLFWSVSEKKQNSLPAQAAAIVLTLRHSGKDTIEFCSAVHGITADKLGKYSASINKAHEAAGREKGQSLAVRTLNPQDVIDVLQEVATAVQNLSDAKIFPDSYLEKLMTTRYDFYKEQATRWGSGLAQELFLSEFMSDVNSKIPGSYDVSVDDPDR